MTAFKSVVATLIAMAVTLLIVTGICWGANSNPPTTSEMEKYMADKQPIKLSANHLPKELKDAGCVPYRVFMIEESEDKPRYSSGQGDWIYTLICKQSGEGVTVSSQKSMSGKHPQNQLKVDIPN